MPAAQRPNFGSLRSRLFLLVLLIVVPASVLLLYTILDTRSGALRRAEANLLQFTQLIADGQQQRIESARDLLTLLARTPEVQSQQTEPCHQRLAETRMLYPEYAGFGVFDLAGVNLCAANMVTNTINLSDRLYFQRARDTQAFAVGEFQVSTTTGRPLLGFGYPILDAQGRLTGILATSIELTTLNREAAVSPLPADAILTIVDRNGLIMVRDPGAENLIGQPLAEPALAQVVGSGLAGVVTDRGPDGQPWLFAYAPIGGLPNVEMYVSVGLPVSAAYAEANTLLTRALFWGGALLLMVLVTAWWWSQFSILKPIGALNIAVGRVRQGDLAARTGVARGGDELSRLAATFDEMAAALAARETQLHAAKQQLDKTFASLDQAVFVVEPTTRLILSANPAVERVFGYRLEDLVGFSTEKLHVDRTHWEAVGAQMLAALEDQGRFHTEFDFRRKDGTTFPAELTVTEFRDETGLRTGVVAVVRDISQSRRYEASLHAARQTAEAAQQRLSLLAEASAQLAASLDIQSTLKLIIQLLLPRWADYCGIFLVKDDGGLASAASGHVKPERDDLVAELSALYPLAANQPSNILGQVVRTGETTLISRPGAWPEPQSAEQARLQTVLNELNPVAVLGVPLLVHGRVLGALMLAMSDSARAFNKLDLPMLEELGRRAAVALDNARLFEQAQQLNVELARRMEIRTSELAISEARYHTFVNSVHDYAIFLLDPSGNIASWNPGAERIKGYTADEIVGRHFSIFYTPEDREAGLPQRALEQAAREGHFHTEGWRLRKDGTRFWANVLISPVFAASGELLGFGKVTRDLTERKAIEDELRESRERLMQEIEARRRAQQQIEQGREAERARIAREVHDELGGALTGLKLGLHRLLRLEGMPARALEQLSELSNEADASAKLVRRIAHELRPSVLDDFGLIVALEWQLGEFQKRSGLSIEWRSAVETLSLPSEAATAAFRIVQEALTNVARHAQANRVVLSVEVEDDCVFVSVADDGRGLPPETEMPAGHLGLVGMRERAALLGGELQITSAPGQGTTISVKIPLN